MQSYNQEKNHTTSINVCWLLLQLFEVTSAKQSQLKHLHTLFCACELHMQMFTWTNSNMQNWNTNQEKPISWKFISEIILTKIIKTTKWFGIKLKKNHKEAQFFRKWQSFALCSKMTLTVHKYWCTESLVTSENFSELRWCWYEKN